MSPFGNLFTPSRISKPQPNAYKVHSSSGNSNQFQSVFWFSLLPLFKNEFRTIVFFIHLLVTFFFQINNQSWFGKAVLRPTVFLPGSQPWWSTGWHSRPAEFAPSYSTKVENTSGLDEESASGSQGPGESRRGFCKGIPACVQSRLLWYIFLETMTWLGTAVVRIC